MIKAREAWDRKSDMGEDDPDPITNSDYYEFDDRDALFELLKRDAYRQGEFTLSSGKTSEHYLNCKPVTLSGKGLVLIGYSLWELVERDSVAVAGLTLGADPLVSIVAAFSTVRDREFGTDRNLNALIVRKEAKGHGTQAWIEGPTLPEGSKVTVLEDVITTGGSSIKAVKRLRDAGYVVNRIVSIIDRQENGEADTAMKLAGLEFYSLFSLDELCQE